MNLRKLMFMMGAGFIALMLGIGGIVTAGEIYESAFGFRAVFPDKWMVLDKSYAIENPQAVESAFLTAQKDKELTPETKATLVSVKEMILRGEIEYYFSENPHFVVAVNKSPGTVPETDEELQNLCRAFPSELEPASPSMFTNVPGNRSTDVALCFLSPTVKIREASISSISSKLIPEM